MTPTPTPHPDPNPNPIPNPDPNPNPNYRWKPWMQTISDFAIDPKTNFQMDYSSIIVPTDQSVCYANLVGRLLDGKKHVLAVGPTGTGKTVTVSQKLSQGLSDAFEPIMMSFSAQTSANQTQAS